MLKIIAQNQAVNAAICYKKSGCCHLLSAMLCTDKHLISERLENDI
jgi:hypothetical protein